MASGVVRKFLDLSTGHLSLAMRRQLENGESPTLMMSGEFGWFVYVADPVVFEEWVAKIPEGECLRPCFALARSLGCEYIMFDCDGPRHNDLPFEDE